jgi:glycosyltransferase involved in cell wall biosynthesis
MKNSVMASIVAYAEALTWNRKVLGNSTDVFICPSSFLRENMIKGGFASDKLRVISNFILEEKLSFVPTERQNYYCYVGRLSAEKGVSSLLEAASEMPQYELKVIGTGPLEDELKARYTGSNIKFEGYKKWPELKEILGNSKFMVMPSVCYENNPLSVIESLCLGTPVVGARIGGIPELIHEGVNGYSYISGNVEDLKAKIRLMFDNAAIFNYREISKEAVKNYNSENYYQEILMIYKSILNAKE